MNKIKAVKENLFPNGEKNRGFIIYVIGIVIITILMLLNSVTDNTLSFDISSGNLSDGYYSYTPHLSLPAGTYTFTANSGSEIIITKPDGGEFGEGTGEAEAVLKKDESEIIIKSNSSTISSVQIKRSIPIFSDNIFISLMMAALLLYIGYIYFAKNSEPKRLAVIITLIAVSVYATYPLFSDYLSYGQDLNFHLFRIEGIKDGLLSGQFPVRVDPTHNNGYGYITASVYPSLFLYFPALLQDNNG